MSRFEITGNIITGELVLQIQAVTRKIFNNTLFSAQRPECSDRRPAFKANTSAGNPLKKLQKFNDIICPYFGVPMISASKETRIEMKIDACKDVKDIFKVLSPYTLYMQPVEKRIFRMFTQYVNKSPEVTLPEILQKHYNEALIKLKLEEFKVLDDVDKISLNLSPAKALEIHRKTTTCRQIILDNSQENTFKRKTLLSSFDDIHIRKDEEDVFEQLKERAIYLPTSVTSENAFIVKYAGRTQQEIAKRLIRTSIGTIEHIKPDSLGGANSIDNFMLVSGNANSTRANMPLAKFIERFPNIPKNCQKYINQIIKIIHNGGFKGYETYPYQIERTLNKESDGKINLNLSKYRYTEETAQNVVKNYYTRSLRRKR